MEDRIYFDKLKHSCAWCHSNHTNIVVESPKNRYGRDGRDDREDMYYNYKRKPIHPEDDRDNNYNSRDYPIFSNHYIIDCYDCAKYSEVQIIRCSNCASKKVNIKRIPNFIDLENTFRPLKNDYFCIECQHYSNVKPPSHNIPSPYKAPCNHNYVKYSGEIFSCGPVFTLKCTYCGETKTTSPNGTEPYNDNYPDGGGY